MFRAFSLAAAIAAFALAILGSWIRINGAGMTCPDWPLCHGAVVPLLEGAVVLEWSHRMVALLEGVLLLGAIVTGWRARRTIAGVTPLLLALGGIFVVQVALGAGTVAVANSPWSVVAHWGMAMLFLGVLTALAIVAILAPRPGATPVQNGLFPLLWFTAAGAFVAMCAGAFVSSSGAGLACSSLPGCEPGSWNGTTAAEGAQMMHRVLAGIFFAVATVVAYWASLGTTPRVRNAALCAYALIVLQVMLGMANVVWQLPLGLREAHAANAAATFIAFIGAIVFAAIDGTVRLPVAARDPAPAQTQSQSQSQPVQAG
jgi:heme A synthase